MSVCFNSLSCAFASIPKRPPLTLRVGHRVAVSFRFSPSSFHCPLKARGDADQPSSSRSCPKKTILLPSSASAHSLHSEVTHTSDLCFLFSCLSRPSPPHQHHPPSPAPPKARVMWVSTSVARALTKRYVSPSEKRRELVRFPEERVSVRGAAPLHAEGGVEGLELWDWEFCACVR